jgi:Xaa-Pro aminopeptidase
MLAALKETLAHLGVTHVGIEADHVTVDAKRRLAEAAPDVEWRDTVGVVGELRAVKSDREVAAIRAAAELTDQAMAHAYEIARPGMAERDLAWQLEVFMRERGAQGTAFAFIVGGGPNGALPHHETGARALRIGEPIVIDIGARLDGYDADLTRTFCWGPASDPDYNRVWELVRTANRAATDAIRPGMTGVAADALARDVIAAAGFGEEFGHGLGHGVGMDIHELPRLGPAAGDATLNAGNVVTVEPGVYLPDRFGVRIEDLAVLRDAGLEVLSHAEKVAELPVPRSIG